MIRVQSGWMVAAVLVASTAAHAGASYSYTARTRAPAATAGAVVASGITWQCAGSQCTTSGPWPTPGVGACAALAQQVGAIAAYGHPGSALSKAQLEECNRGVRVAAAAPGAAPGANMAAVPSGQQPITAPRPGALAAAQVATRTQLFADLAKSRIPPPPPPGTPSAQYLKQRREGVSVGTDCNDLKANANPHASEVCDSLDNNCDGQVDEGATLPRFLDADGDGHGDPARRLDVCPWDITVVNRRAHETGGQWLVELGNDCDDRDPDRWRGC